MEFKEYIDGSSGDLSLNDLGGRVKLDSNLTGIDVASVEVIQNEVGDYSLSLKFNQVGAEKFSRATSALIGSQISVWIDGEFIIAPIVNSVITDGIVTISGNYSYDAAYDLSLRIQSGCLPTELKLSESGVLKSTQK